MNNISVSVVIPLYNHSKYIYETIESVKKQSLQPAEVIIIDDGSTDDSLAIVKKLALEYECVKVYSKDNSGAHNTINAGILFSKSEYISILNSDDVYANDRLEILYNEALKNPQHDILTTGIGFINDWSDRIKNNWYVDSLTHYREYGDLDISLLNANFLMTTSNFFFKRSVVERIGLFSSFRYAHDLEFLMRAIRAGLDIKILEKELLLYRYHNRNTISEDQSKVRREWASIIAYHIFKAGQNSNTVGKSLYDLIKFHTLQDLVMVFITFYQANSSMENLCASSWMLDKTLLDLLRTLQL